MGHALKRMLTARGEGFFARHRVALRVLGNRPSAYASKEQISVNKGLIRRSAWEADDVAIWKQLLWSLCVGLIALLIAAKLSPTTASFLAGHGFSAPMRLTGPTQAEASTDAGAASAAGKAGAAAKGGAPTDPAAQGTKPGNRGQGRKAAVVVQPAGTVIINAKVTAL